MPRLTATRPNAVWTWDITKLATTRRGVYLNLYVVMDLFSRYVVAWMVSRKENSQLAQQLMEQTLTRYGLDNQQVTLHQDRGSPMIAKSFLDLMADFGVVCSHSRPRVSSDNPYSESQFKTLKHQPDYPGRFDSPGHARLWASDYFAWYNHEHHHSGLNGFTPAQVYTGEFTGIAKNRQAALTRYYEKPMSYKERLTILHEAEINDLYGIPSLSLEGKRVSFALNDPEQDVIKSIRDRNHKCYAIALLGYFKIKPIQHNPPYKELQEDLTFIAEEYFAKFKVPRFSLGFIE